MSATWTHQPMRPRTAASARSRRRLGLGGRLIVFLFTVVPLSGILMVALPFGDVRIASFSGTAIIGALAGLASWTLVSLYPRVPASASRVAGIFALFGIAMIGSAMLGGTTRQGIQFVQVLTAALGALLLAAAARRSLGSSLDAVVARCMRVTSVILIGAAVAHAAGADIDVSPRTSAIAALIGIGWFLAEHRAGRAHALRWVLAILITIIVSLSRTALLAGFVVVAVTLIAGAPRHRLRGTALALLLIAGGYWAITSWGPLHDRFFQGDVSLSIGGLSVNAEGRTEVWGVLWSEVADAALLGHGPGAASARSIALEPSFDHPHMDYLRLAYDFGALGCALLVGCVVCVVRSLRRAKLDGVITVPARAALTSGLAVLVVMVTDNPLDYPFVMIPLGALVGLGLGSVPERVSTARLRSPGGFGSPPRGSWASRSSS